VIGPIRYGMIQSKQAEALCAELSRDFGDRFFRDRSLAGYTTFKIGGPARFFVECREQEEIIAAVNLAHRLNLKYFILGGGSNLLVSDEGYSGLVIYVATRRIVLEDESVVVDAGYDWEKLVDFFCERGLQGIEMMAGIKGTVGGAVYGNAGAYGSSLSSVLLEAEIFAAGQPPRWEKNNYFAFSYRNSILKKTREVVLRARLGFHRDEPEALQAKKAEILALRAQKHPDWDCSAGCFFKNIEKADEPHGKLAAGMLLEQVGAKTMRVGDAKVFEKHANILINSGSATAADIRRLAKLLKEKVKAEYGYELEEEITFLGD